MQRVTRNLCLDVCNYENEVLCNIYDNTMDISGQAANVFIVTERNGWKELSFSLPYTAFEEDGEQPNYRIDYLVADYRIRAIDDFETDYYLISEPHITHDDFSKRVTVKAAHIAQILKTKALDLEFSDNEGNNVGTAEQLLTTILDGTGWHVGYVEDFKEDDKQTTKIRSLIGGPKVGALGLINKLCELFDARPIYHGATRTVDIVHINPFSEDIEPGDIPDEVINGHEVLEIRYSEGAKNIERSYNTDNIATRLYAYGASGTIATGNCTIQIAEHTEYIINAAGLSAGQESCFKDSLGFTYYFTPTDNVTGNLIFSELDFMSRKYVWNPNTRKAYRVYSLPNDGAHEPLSCTTETVVNEFPFLMNFNYYDEVGLLSEENFQYIAQYQRDLPTLYVTAREKSEAMLNANYELSQNAESYDGFLRLDISGYSSDEGYLKLNIKKTDTYPDGVMYRSDYLESRRHYFTWYVAEQVKPNGIAINDIGSLVYIVHDTNPVTWEIAYLKKINGVAEKYMYDISEGEPNNVTLWLDRDKVPVWSDTDRFYLFCTYGGTGSLHSLLTEADSVKDSLGEALATDAVFSPQPIYFSDARKEFPSTSEIADGVGWCYRYNPSDLNAGTLYFCHGQRDENTWHKSAIQDTQPSDNEATYWLNTRNARLYQKISGTWTLLDSVDDNRLAEAFGQVYKAGRQLDVIYKGLYQRYGYNPDTSLPIGRYAIDSGYGYYWLFTTNEVIQHSATTSPLYIDTEKSYAVQNATDSSVVNAEHLTTCDKRDFDVLIYPQSSIFTADSFSNGSVDPETGLDVDSTIFKRTTYTSVYEGETYEYSLPSGSFALIYDMNNQRLNNIVLVGQSGVNHVEYMASLAAYLEYMKENTPAYQSASEEAKKTYVAGWTTYYNNTISNIGNGSGSGEYAIPARGYYIRIVCPSVPASGHYFRVKNYNKKVDYVGNLYTVLSPVNKEGELVGINETMKKFADGADNVYLTLLAEYNAAQNAINQRNKDLADTLGDLLRDGWWQENNYVESDIKKLYDDAIDNLKEIAKPETVYNINFLDRYGSDNDAEYAADPDINPDWQDIQVDFAVHLIDEELGTNQYAYIDKINKCYDQPWKTTLEINTRLSLIAQHDFTDVLARIAEVASQTKARQGYYEQGVSGTVLADRIEGIIQANRVYITGGASNWYTDANGNIVFEAADGYSAMLLSGRGWAVADSKDIYGDWNWRSMATGSGLNADLITSGHIMTSLLEAHGITAEYLHASVGQELEIGSNKALLLYATTSGSRPSGALKTSDAVIEITAGAEQTGVPAKIDIKSGGSLNMYGGTEVNLESGADMNIKAESDLNIYGGQVNVTSGGDIHIGANGTFTVQGNNFNIDGDGNVAVKGDITADTGHIAGYTIAHDPGPEPYTRQYMYAGECDNISSTNKGVYIGTDGVNLGGKIIANNTGSTTTVTGDISYLSISSGNNTRFIMDGPNGTVTISSGTHMSLSSGAYLDVVSGGNVTIGNSGSPFTIGSNGTNAYIYNGMTTYDSTSSGIYLGTNGIALGGGKFKASSTGNVYLEGEIKATTGQIGGWHIGSDFLANNAQLAKTYAPNEDGGATVGMHSSKSATYSFWAGGPYSDTAANPQNRTYPKFSVTPEGKLTSTSASIGGWDITGTYFRSSKQVTENGTEKTYSATLTKIDTKNTPAISVGSSSGTSNEFYVRYDGYMKATSAYIDGEIHADSLYVGGNNIISSNKISLGTNTFGGITGTNFTITTSGINITSAGVLQISTTNFSLDNSGNAEIRGKVTATSGFIGDFTINSAIYTNSKTTIDANTTGVYIGSDGISLGANVSTQDTRSKFRVTSSGELFAQNATITGIINAGAGGKIGGWDIGTSTITSAKVGLQAWASGSGDSNISIYAGNDTPASAPFRVTKGGSLTSTSGTIGGWNIGEHTLWTSATYGNKTYTATLLQAQDTDNPTATKAINIMSDGANTFYVTYAGKTCATDAEFIGSFQDDANSPKIDINANGTSTIGGWTLGTDKLYGTNYTTGMCKSTTTGDVVFWCGNTSAQSGNTYLKTSTFYVTADGAMHANSATIKGAIQSGSTISGTDITGGSITIKYGSNTILEANTLQNYGRIGILKSDWQAAWIGDTRTDLGNIFFEATENGYVFVTRFVLWDTGSQTWKVGMLNNGVLTWRDLDIGPGQGQDHPWN